MARNESLCQGEAREPAASIDHSLTNRGWLLWGEPLQSSGVTVVPVAMGIDQQCRPVGISVFIHREGRYLAAVTPTSDEELLEVTVEGGTLVLRQQFAQDDDARCCPSGLRSLKLPLEQFR